MNQVSYLVTHEEDTAGQWLYRNNWGYRLHTILQLGYMELTENICITDINHNKATNIEIAQHMDSRLPENRKHVRYQIDHDTIPIFDLGAASSLGQIENITVGGCLLLSDQAAISDQVFSIIIPVPGQLDERCAVRCLARSLWSSPSEEFSAQGNQSLEKFWTGYEFLDISDNGIETIAALIAMLGRPPN